METKKIEGIKINIPELENAYGLYLIIDRETKVFSTKIDAKRKIDVCVEVEGVKKEFTWNEFERRLGFK